MIPAVAVAMPMPIMLRAPAIRPSISSSKPSLAWPTEIRRSAEHAEEGRWVMITNIKKAVAQKAERPGDRRSTIRHQTSTITGKM